MATRHGGSKQDFDHGSRQRSNSIAKALDLLQLALTCQSSVNAKSHVREAHRLIAEHNPEFLAEDEEDRGCTSASTSCSDDVTRGLNNESIIQRFRLVSKVALVTGAGQGIGRAFAHALGEAGASVAVADINIKNAQLVTEELRSKGINSIAVHTDVSKKADCAKMVETVVAELGGLHIAVNNAGIIRNSPAEDTTEEEWDLTFAINTKGVFFSCQEEGRHMLAQGYGKIINTASLNTVVVLHPEKQIAYNASKAAVAKITQTLGTEWANRGLNVNCISPGIVDTALVQKAKDRFFGVWLPQIPAGRLAQVTDLQAAIVFMASDASSYMVGHNLVIDGGQSIW
ncbi:hypothetical protein ABBQ32_002066 [Trebouxia sp. C0010 RCD-2024]